MAVCCCVNCGGGFIANVCAQHIHVSPSGVHDWICTNDEYSRLLIPANDTNSELIVCTLQISCLFLANVYLGNGRAYSTSCHLSICLFVAIHRL